MEWEAEEDTYTVGEERDAAHVNERKPGVITMLFSKKQAQIWKKKNYKKKKICAGFPKTENIASVDLQWIWVLVNSI